MYHYLVGIGYNKTKIEVDAIIELTPEDIKLGIVKSYLNKDDVPKKAALCGFFLRLRYAMLDMIHLKSEFKMDRDIIETYVKSLEINELQRLIKRSEKELKVTYKAR